MKLSPSVSRIRFNESFLEKFTHSTFQILQYVVLDLRKKFEIQPSPQVYPVIIPVEVKTNSINNNF